MLQRLITPHKFHVAQVIHTHKGPYNDKWMIIIKYPLKTTTYLTLSLSLSLFLNYQSPPIMMYNIHSSIVRWAIRSLFFFFFSMAESPITHANLSFSNPQFTMYILLYCTHSKKKKKEMDKAIRRWIFQYPLFSTTEREASVYLSSLSLFIGYGLLESTGYSSVCNLILILFFPPPPLSHHVNISIFFHLSKIILQPVLLSFFFLFLCSTRGFFSFPWVYAFSAPPSPPITGCFSSCLSLSLHLHPRVCFV